MEHLEVVSRIYDAWNRRDPDCEGFWAVDAEGYDLQRAPGAPPVVHGIRAIKRGWLRWMLLIGDISAELEEHTELDDWVICITHWHGSRTAKSAPVDFRSVEAIQIRDGKIRRFEHGYESKEHALDAVRALVAGSSRQRP